MKANANIKHWLKILITFVGKAFSFFFFWGLSHIASFFAWGVVLDLAYPNVEEHSIGEGIGLILILFLVLPITGALVIHGLSKRFEGQFVFLTRGLYCIFVPSGAAIILSAALSYLLVFNR